MPFIPVDFAELNKPIDIELLGIGIEFGVVHLGFDGEFETLGDNGAVGKRYVGHGLTHHGDCQCQFVSEY